MTTFKRLPPRQSNRARLRCEELESRATPATFTVDTVLDTPDANLNDGVAKDQFNKTSLRAAIEQGNFDDGAHTIYFSGTEFGSGFHQIWIENEQLELDANYTVNAPTTGTVTLSPLSVFGNNYRILKVNGGTTSTIKHITFSNGFLPNGTGGAILNNGNLTLENCNITYNTASSGGGIANHKELWLTNCTVSGNDAYSDGGGISTAANAGCKTYLNLTVVSGNKAGSTGVAGKGGGISVLGNATLEVQGGRITGNEAIHGGMGGGIYNSGGTISVDNCELTANSATTNGGALYVAGGSSTVLKYLAVSENSAGVWGGGLFAEPITTTSMIGVTFTATNTAGTGGAKVAYSGALNTNVTITLTDCTGITGADLTDIDP